MSAALSPAPPTRAELVARAAALKPALRERAAACEAARRVPDETIADFHRAGFFRILQPARWGGYELDPQTFYEVQIQIASACPSSAWVLGVLSVHSWQLALFDPAAQEDVWGGDDRVLISSSYMPVGKVTPVEGGYRLSGRWGFSSGSDHCRWAFLGAFVPTGEGQPPDMRTFLVPRGEYRIEDTWHVAGLKGTGSNDVVVEDAFIPEHHTHRFFDGFRCQSPGNALNDGPLFRLPFGQIFVRSVSTPAIGMARGALEAFREVTLKKVSRADGVKASENPTAQRAMAEAEATIDEAELVLYRNFDELMAAARAGAPVSVERRVKFRYDSARAVGRCVAAVDALTAAGGGGGIFLSHPVQRFFQDIHACQGHYANNPEKPALNQGWVMLGQRTQDYFV
jgi:3-hydroxy-9,10-secoandrosta-1,3,5(10)-triene-9,17-dione monooxygenase